MDVRIGRPIADLGSAEAASPIVLCLRRHLQVLVPHPVFPCS
jgi:hypothetical protein